MKDNIETLLNRRKELQEQINKLQEEYTALGNVITKILKIAEQEKEESTLKRINEQIDEQTRNGRTDIYIDNKDLGFISGIAMNEGRSVIDAKQLQGMLDDFER